MIRVRNSCSVQSSYQPAIATCYCGISLTPEYLGAYFLLQIEMLLLPIACCLLLIDLAELDSKHIHISRNVKRPLITGK